jgi:hypothetical protein
MGIVLNSRLMRATGTDEVTDVTHWLMLKRERGKEKERIRS